MEGGQDRGQQALRHVLGVGKTADEVQLQFGRGGGGGGGGGGRAATAATAGGQLADDAGKVVVGEPVNVAQRQATCS